jgi:hypothetical protein
MIVLLIVGREASEPTYGTSSAMGVTILTGRLVNGAGGGASSCRIHQPPSIHRRKECRAVLRIRGFVTLPVLPGALLVLSLAACSDSNDPSSTGLSEAETRDVAEAVADEGYQSLEAVQIGRLGCAEVSVATFTFPLPACSFTGFRGGTLEITGGPTRTFVPVS